MGNVISNGNIVDFIRDGHAWFRCTQCGSETTILQWDFDHQRGYEVINPEKSGSSIAAFVERHKLCKPSVIQTDLFNPESDAPMMGMCY